MIKLVEKYYVNPRYIVSVRYCEKSDQTVVRIFESQNIGYNDIRLGGDRVTELLIAIERANHERSSY